MTFASSVKLVSSIGISSAYSSAGSRRLAIISDDVHSFCWRPFGAISNIRTFRLP